MEIVATRREILGKKNKDLRNDRKIPAVVYGEGIESTPLTISTQEFINVFKEAGETALIDLKYDGKSGKVLIKEVQLNPINSLPVHASFHKVSLTEKIKANIPVEVVGEAESPVVKSGEGLVLVLLNEIEVEALPSDLPQKFEVNVSHLEAIGQNVLVSELKYDKSKVEILDISPEDMVVKIDYAEMQEEVEEVVDEAALIEGMEVTGEKPEEEEGAEGEEGKEGKGGGEVKTEGKAEEKGKETGPEEKK